jgi:hypothetical protein
MVKCVVPSTDIPGAISMKFSTNGVDIDDYDDGTNSRNGNDLLFTYHPDLHVYNIEPTFGSISGGTLVEVHGQNFYYSPAWYCVFGNTATKALWLSNEQIQCQSPPIDSMQANEVSFEIQVISDSNSSIIYIDGINGMELELGKLANGKYMKFTYVPQFEVVRVNPSSFLSGNIVPISVYGDLRATFDETRFFCMWYIYRLISESRNNDDYGYELTHIDRTEGYYATSHSAESLEAIVCPTPYLAPNIDHKLKLKVSINSNVESSKFFDIFAMRQPQLYDVSPKSFWALEEMENITIYGGDLSWPNLLHVAAYPPRSRKSTLRPTLRADVKCLYYHGLGNLIDVKEGTVTSNNTIECSASPKMTPLREIQRVRISGRDSTREVQIIDVLSHHQREIQRISIKAWGIQHAKYKLKAAPTIADQSNRGIYRLSSSVTNKKEIQEILIQPLAYIQEIQTISINLTLSYLNERYTPYEDSGMIVLNVGLWNFTAPWNCSSDTLMDTMKSSVPIIQDVSITKEYSSTYREIEGLQGGFQEVTLIWHLEFGKAVGNIPEITIVDYDIPRAAIFDHTSLTSIDGLACELQEVRISGATSGGFILSFDGYLSDPIQFDASANDFKRAILSNSGNNGFVTVADVDVVKHRDSPRSTRWFIYFTDTPGSLPLVQLYDQSLLDSSSYGFVPILTTTKLVGGQAVGLSGFISLSGGGLSTVSQWIDVGLNASQVATLYLNPLLEGYHIISSLDGPKRVYGSSIHWIFEYSSDSVDVPGIVVNSTTQLNGTTPTINVRELQKGSNSTITSIGGFINVIVSNITGYGTVSSRSFSTSILEDSLSSIFFDLGMGETRIIQIVDNDQKTIFWDIEFHEIPQMYFDNEYIKFSSEALNDEVNMTVTFERIQPSQSGCCMSPDSGSFSIWNSRENKISQFTLNSRSSSIDVLRVLVDLTSLKSDCIDIKQYDRPSFGRSWLIEFIADGKCFPLLSNDTLNIIENLEVFSINPFDVPNTGSGILNSHPAVWSTIDHPRLPECQRLILKGNNLLETTFILQLGNFSTRFS